jgi:hypothetical protein
VFCQFLVLFLAFLCDHFLQADCLDDLAFAIMQEMSKLSYKVTEEDVIRARNQVNPPSSSSLVVLLATLFSHFTEVWKRSKHVTCWSLVQLF